MPFKILDPQSDDVGKVFGVLKWTDQGKAFDKEMDKIIDEVRNILMNSDTTPAEKALQLKTMMRGDNADMYAIALIMFIHYVANMKMKEGSGPIIIIPGP